MGFRKLKTVLELVNSFLTGYLSSLAFGSVTSFFRIKGAFFAFFSKTCAIFFSGFRRKHLFIKTWIEKQCTWPLRQRLAEIRFQLIVFSNNCSRSVTMAFNCPQKLSQCHKWQKNTDIL